MGEVRLKSRAAVDNGGHWSPIVDRCRGFCDKLKECHSSWDIYNDMQGNSTFSKLWLTCQYRKIRAGADKLILELEKAKCELLLYYQLLALELQVQGLGHTQFLRDSLDTIHRKPDTASNAPDELHDESRSNPDRATDDRLPLGKLVVRQLNLTRGKVRRPKKNKTASSQATVATPSTSHIQDCGHPDEATMAGSEIDTRSIMTTSTCLTARTRYSLAEASFIVPVDIQTSMLCETGDVLLCEINILSQHGTVKQHIPVDENLSEAHTEFQKDANSRGTQTSSEEPIECSVFQHSATQTSDSDGTGYITNSSVVDKFLEDCANYEETQSNMDDDDDENISSSDDNSNGADSSSDDNSINVDASNNWDTSDNEDVSFQPLDGARPDLESENTSSAAPDEDARVFTLLMDVVHLNRTEVPDRVDFKTLLQFLLLARHLDFLMEEKRICRQAKLWIEFSKEAIPTTLNDHMMPWLWILRTLDMDEEFEALVTIAQTQSRRRIEQDSEFKVPLPAKIIGRSLIRTVECSLLTYLDFIENGRVNFLSEARRILERGLVGARKLYLQEFGSEARYSISNPDLGILMASLSYGHIFLGHMWLKSKDQSSTSEFDGISVSDICGYIENMVEFEDWYIRTATPINRMSPFVTSLFTIVQEFGNLCTIRAIVGVEPEDRVGLSCFPIIRGKPVLDYWIRPRISELYNVY
ncbi:hypothetical protein AUP68_10437 [Ilyonectria robusta]